MKDGQPFNPFGLFHGIFIPDAIKESHLLTSHAKILMGQLLHYSGKNGKAFPSRKKLCKDLNFSMSMLDRSIKLLKKEKLIKTYKKDDRSPSTYIFLYKSTYYDANHSTEGAAVTCDSGAAVTYDSGGAVICDSYKEINKERDHKRKRNFSTKNCKTSGKGSKDSESSTNGVPSERAHRRCARLSNNSLKDANKSCKKVKVKIRRKKHKTLANGKVSIAKHKETQNLTSALPKLPRIMIKPNPLKKFNFAPEVFEILNHWKNLGGKIPKDPNRRKIADQIVNQIQELLIPGNNPYTKVLKDNELEKFRNKQWTIKDIKDSITYFKKELCKPIDKFSFLQFIIHRNYNGNHSLRDYSPLVETYQLLPQKFSYLAKKIKEDFTSNFPNVHIYDKSFINIATFIEQKFKEYKPYQSYASNTNFEPRFVNDLFYIYMNKKVISKGTPEELQYMANPQNLNEFINWCKSLNLITPILANEKQEYFKELKQGYRNQLKSYQMDIDNGKSDKWSQETWDYFNFMKGEVNAA